MCAVRQSGGVPVPGTPLRRLGFLTIGLFDPADPGPGHETTLQMIELGERLGFDSAWVRHRHLQYGISSPVALLAAATQRTRRIALGTAVIPLGWENPLRLAEDLATVDVLSGGRLNPGLSVGSPMRYDDVRAALYPDTAEIEDFSYTRVNRLLDLLEGKPASTFSGTVGIEQFSDHVQPHSPGLRERMWYGAGSLRSAGWAGEHELNLLVSNVVRATESRRLHSDPAGADPRLPRGPPPGPGVPGPGRDCRPTGPPRSSGRSTPPTSRRAPRASGYRRGRPGCCSRTTCSAPRKRSPSGCTPTPGSWRWTRSRSRCRSPSLPRTTSSCSPTSRSGSARSWAGARPAEPAGPPTAHPGCVRHTSGSGCAACSRGVPSAQGRRRGRRGRRGGGAGAAHGGVKRWRRVLAVSVKSARSGHDQRTTARPVARIASSRRFSASTASAAV